MVITSLNGYNYPVTANSNVPLLVNIPFLQVMGPGFDYRNLGFKVTSFSPISVVGISSHGNIPRLSFLGLPHHEYLSVKEYAYLGVSSSSSNLTLYSEVLLVGCRDNTTVTIYPSHNITLPLDPQTNDTLTDTINVSAGESYSATLHSQQTLLIATSDGGDLSGTRVTSNRPLTVIGGHECGEEPIGYRCGPLATQTPPTITWDTHFLLPALRSENGQKYKVISSEPNTIVSSTCDREDTTIVTLSAVGDVYSFLTNQSVFCSLTCSQRCYVAQFGLSGNYLTDIGIPFITSIVPISQYPHSVTFTAQIPTSLYSITVPASEYFNGTILINGDLVNRNWVPMYNSTGSISGYGYTDVFNGTITVTHPHPMGSIYLATYGVTGDEGGYGYVTGTLLDPIFPQVSFSPEEYCVLGSDWFVVSLERQRDLNVNFIIQITSPNISKLLDY